MTLQPRNQSFSLHVLVWLLSSFIAQPAFSQTLREQLADQTGEDEAEQVEQSPWSFDLTTSLSSSTMHPDESNYIIRAYMSIGGYYQVTPSLSLFGGLGGAKDLNKKRKNTLTDSYLGGDYSLFSAGNFSSKVTATLSLPLDYEERKYENYLGSLQVSPSVRYRLDSYVSGLALASRLTIARNMHKYRTNEGGQHLEKQSLAYLINLTYGLPFDLSLSARFGTRKSWDFNGDAFRSTYSATQSLSYFPLPSWIFTLSHSNGGYTYDYNGSDFDFRIYDDSRSIITVSASYSH